MSLRETITPETVTAILAHDAKHHPEHMQNYNLNMGHSLISRCKIGTIFVDRAGDYCVFTGIARSRKKPIACTRINDRSPRIHTMHILDKILNTKE
jgi:hypothetical protein